MMKCLTHTGGEAVVQSERTSGDLGQTVNLIWADGIGDGFGSVVQPGQ
jgi:hypothetical protein